VEGTTGGDFRACDPRKPCEVISFAKAAPSTSATNSQASQMNQNKQKK
jgi:hypothetical protein